MKYVTHNIIIDILLMSYILDTYIFLFLSIQKEISTDPTFKIIKQLHIYKVYQSIK